MSERHSRLEGIRKQINTLGFEAYAVSLYQSVKETELDIKNLKNFTDTYNDSATETETLKNIFATLPDYTSKIELLHKLRQKLIVSTARKLGCNKIFIADDSTSLAIAILSNVSLGRGAQLSLDVSFLDTRYPDVLILRPMRDFTRHELNSYLNIHKLQTVESGDLIDTATSPQCIQRLTEKFVTDLDSRFNGTVSTVFRTGEKVCGATSGDNQSTVDICVVCDAPLDTRVSDTVISAIKATAFSRLLSTEGPNANIDLTKVAEIATSEVPKKNQNSGCGNCNGSTTCGKSKNANVALDELHQFLCYGCRLIFKNSDMNNIPYYILDAVRQRLSLESMREEITQFLL